MAKKKYRVVHCGTGPTGRAALLGIANRPDLELVGHLVFDPAKEGEDAGELGKLGPKLGISATRDIDALLALKPDCLSFFGDGVGQLQSSLSAICRFLEAGVNVGTASLYDFSHPATAPAELREPIERACASGNSSFYNSGVDPGTAIPWMAAALLKMADEVSEVRMQEIANYGRYNVEWVMRDVYGFGKPLEYRGALSGGSVFKRAFTGSVNAVAERMGVKLEDWRIFFENCTHDRTHETTWGTVEAGTVAAVRFGIEGIYNGKPFIVLEHVNRTALEAAPHWPQPRFEEGSQKQHQHVVLVKGDPELECRIDTGTVTRNGSDGGVAATAMTIVNAIPSVIEHAPGIVDEMDLPLYATRNIRV